MGDQGCRHPERVSGVCRRCGDCLHEVILNGVCYFCGDPDPRVTVKPVETPAIVPLSRLKKGP